MYFEKCIHVCLYIESQWSSLLFLAPLGLYWQKLLKHSKYFILCSTKEKKHHTGLDDMKVNKLCIFIFDWNNPLRSTNDGFHSQIITIILVISSRILKNKLVSLYKNIKENIKWKIFKKKCPYNESHCRVQYCFGPLWLSLYWWKLLKYRIFCSMFGKTCGWANDVRS